MTRPFTLCFVLLPLAACQPPPPEDSSGKSDSCTAADDSGPVVVAPSIRMIFPASSETLSYCSTFPLVVVVENFTLAPTEIEQATVEGHGHYHFYDADQYQFAAATEWTILPPEKALTPGRHALKVELVANDHQSFSPPVDWLTEITVDDTSVDGEGNPNCIGGGTGEGLTF